MKKLLFLLFFPCLAQAGDLTLWQNQGGNIGSAIFHPVGQISFDTSTTSGHPSGIGDLSWNMTIGPGQNRLLVVACGTDLNDRPTAIQVAGNAMTLSASTANVSGQAGSYIWTYLNPPIGNQGIAATFASGIPDRGVCTSISFFGVNQTNPVDVSTGTVNYPGASTQTVTMVTTTPQEVLIDMLTDINVETMVPGAGQGVVTKNVFSFWAIGVSTKAAQSPASYNMTWTNVNAPLAQAGLSIRPAQ